MADGVLYFGDGNNYVHALAVSNGATIWTYQTGGTVQSSPAVANGIVYVGSEDGNVYALSATSGQEIWSVQTGGAVDSSPTVAGGVVYIGSDDHRVYALRASSGAVLWAQSVGGQVTSRPLAGSAEWSTLAAATAAFTPWTRSAVLSAGAGNWVARWTQARPSTAG